MGSPSNAGCINKFINCILRVQLVLSIRSIVIYTNKIYGSKRLLGEEAVSKE